MTNTSKNARIILLICPLNTLLFIRSVMTGVPLSRKESPVVSLSSGIKTIVSVKYQKISFSSSLN
ncbi:hypothetical protein ES708_18098 [subsurface metagenome]